MDSPVDTHLTKCGEGKYRIETHKGSALPALRQEQLVAFLEENKAAGCFKDAGVSTRDPVLTFVLLIKEDQIVAYADYRIVRFTARSGVEHNVMILLFTCTAPALRGKNISKLLCCKAFVQGIEQGVTTIVVQAESDDMKHILDAKFGFESVKPESPPYHFLSTKIGYDFNREHDVRSEEKKGALLSDITAVLSEPCKLPREAGGSRRSLRACGVRRKRATRSKRV